MEDLSQVWRRSEGVGWVRWREGEEAGGRAVVVVVPVVPFVFVPLVVVFLVPVPLEVAPLEACVVVVPFVVVVVAGALTPLV